MVSHGASVDQHDPRLLHDPREPHLLSLSLSHSMTLYAFTFSSSISPIYSPSPSSSSKSSSSSAPSFSRTPSSRLHIQEELVLLLLFFLQFLPFVGKCVRWADLGCGQSWEEGGRWGFGQFIRFCGGSGMSSPTWRTVLATQNLPHLWAKFR